MPIIVDKLVGKPKVGHAVTEVNSSIKPKFELEPQH